MSGPNGQVLEEAADWFARLQDPALSEQERRRWLAWQQASPQHAAAWREVEAVWGSLSPLQALPARLAQETLARAGLQRRRLLKRSGAALLGLGGVATLGWQIQALHPLADLRTAVGQRGHWTLADGAGLWLNSASAADLSEDGSRRSVQLRHGELLLDSRSDRPALPRVLQLDTPLGQLRPLGVLGARMAVLLEDGGRQGLLSVYSGVVELRHRRGQTRRIEAGQSLRLSAQSAVAPLRPATALREAWTRGLLVAEQLRLDEFLHELSRHRHGRLDCPEALAARRLVGAYPLRDPKASLAAAVASLGLRTRTVLPGWTRVVSA